MKEQKVLDKLESLFKEEVWGRIEPRDVGISKFKILDDIFNAVVFEGLIESARNLCIEHQKNHDDSVIAAYLIGLIGYHSDRIEDSQQLRRLIDIFIANHKWAVVKILAEKILEYGESRVALRALATCLERLGQSREAIPVWENLLKIDRFDADVAKKLAVAIINDHPEKSIQYMKLSIEGFIKNKDYEEIPSLWNKLVSLSWDDLAFYERIERQLVEAKQEELAAGLLKSLLVKYRDEDNTEQAIHILKKIIEYRPMDTHARRELIKLYETEYSDHSQFEQFMKLSKLSNFKAPAKLAIQDFERNIVFDKGNYVFHNSWQLGKITEISSDHLIIDFKDKPSHRMSVQMALQSLTPIPKDHLYVMEYEDPEMVKSLFENDLIQFFDILIKSYDGKVLLADIKREITSRFVDEKNWAKWWNRARTKIKKNPHYGISEKRKDLIYLRDKPVTFADELLENFTSTDSFTEKLNIAIEFCNNIDIEEGGSVVSYFIDYFMEEIKGKSSTRQILSYFTLKGLAEFSDPGKLKLDSIRTKIISFIKDCSDLHLISMKISSYDYKKDFINLLEEARDDWQDVVAEILFEMPVRIHKYIINKLIMNHSFKRINSFINRSTIAYKQYPEIFIWVAKNLLNHTWDYEWLDFSRKNLILTFFRLMNELKKIESEGNRLKNIVIDILFDNEAFVLNDIIEDQDQNFLGKLYDLFSNLSFVEESQAERFLGLIKKRFPDFQIASEEISDYSDVDEERLIVTREGFNRKKTELDRMSQEEMAELARELASVAEVTADMRENVEYNALLEKQSILKLAISRLDEEIKKADILDENAISTDSVNVGTRLVIEDSKNSTQQEYVILGPWDADFEKNILSYRSPIARNLLGKKLNEEFDMKIDDDIKKFKIVSIEKYFKS